LVSTLCICIVFVPIFFLSGVAKFLFAPLAEAVIFAMLASYLLSRTLVPTLAMYFFGKGSSEGHGQAPVKERRGLFAFLGWFGAFHRAFERRFEAFREGYRDFLSFSLRHAGLLVIFVILFVTGSMCLVNWLGQDFFPAVDAGRFDLHVRMPTGTR